MLLLVTGTWNSESLLGLTFLTLPYLPCHAARLAIPLVIGLFPSEYLAIVTIAPSEMMKSAALCRKMGEGGLSRGARHSIIPKQCR